MMNHDFSFIIRAVRLFSVGIGSMSNTELRMISMVIIGKFESV